MRTPVNRLRSTLIVCLSAILMIPSCGLFREDPMYVGTWQNKDKIYVGDATYNTTTTLKLSESTFEEVYVVQPDNSSVISTLLGLKGSLDVSGSKMTFRLTAVGECVKDNQQNCTSAVEWFQKGSATYNTYLQYLKETVKGEFEADEDYLWLVRDRNLDGDTDDSGEDIGFERL